MTSPIRHIVHSKGIYHGLPDVSFAPTGLTAIVTGANGISGAHMLRVLAESPGRWRRIYALSRRPPSGTWPETVEHSPLDFLKSPSSISEELKTRNIKPDYVFYFSYALVVDEKGALQWGDQRLVDRNNLLLSNFLEALLLAEALPLRIFIQFGQKWYGVHLGATDIPDSEDDPRLSLEPNLYYTQHDILETFCSKHNISWNSALPSFIIGAALDSSQSLLFPLLVYACVQKYHGLTLQYPSDTAAWYAPQSLSSAVLNSYFYEWSVLASNTANQVFNISDDCAFTWGKLWPKLAKYFDMEYTGPDVTPNAQFKEKGMGYEPPPHGKGTRSVTRYKFSFVDWAKDPANIEAWQQLARKHKLRESEWHDVGSVFGRADFCLHRPYASIMSATKAKKHGFFGFVDSFESILSVIDEFVAMEIIPNPNHINSTE